MENQNYHMGANFLFHSLSGKWKLSIICALSIKKFRYLELLNYEREQHHNNISRKVLSEQLNQLENDGIIVKKNFGTVPPKVVYSLSNLGEKIADNLLQLNKMGEIMANNSQDEISFDISANEVEKRHLQKSTDLK